MLTTLFPIAYSRYTSLPVLGTVLEDLCSWLKSRGYPTNAIRRRIQAAPFLDQCLRKRHIESLSGCTAEQLRACFPREDRWTPQIAYALGRSLLSHLEERGDLAITPTASERLIDNYRQHLERVRGFAAATIWRHADVAGDFLNFLGYEDDPQRLARIQSADLEGFILEASSHLGRVAMQKVITIMRSFLKFLSAIGRASVGLDRYLEAPRHYRGQHLARAIPWNEALSILRAVDQSTVKGCRDYAMLLLIATYGLRPSEVSSLRLDDIQWRSRVISVPRPKIGTPLVVPLTDEVATALSAYLRARAADSDSRRLFLRVRAPRGPILSSGIGDAFDFWTARAGVRVPGLGGPYVLRHGLAMNLLRRGTPLKTIGDLLGHRSVESTGIYLRLQIEDLRDVALPLPARNLGSEVRP
jgi:site-specific recombinase XerD